MLRWWWLERNAIVRLRRTGLFGLTPGASGGGIYAQMKDWARFVAGAGGLMLAGAGIGR